jgi:hypothetical protein
MLLIYSMMILLGLSCQFPLFMLKETIEKRKLFKREYIKISIMITCATVIIGTLIITNIIDNGLLAMATALIVIVSEMLIISLI